jgi:hypothetical protein
MNRNIVELGEILPGLEINFSRWWESERDVIEPALRAAGYIEIGGWFSTEHDSFGPLGRAVRAKSPDGKLLTICYG